VIRKIIFAIRFTDAKAWRINCVIARCYIRKVSFGSEDSIKGNNTATHICRYIQTFSQVLENAFLIAAYKCKFIIINAMILLYYSFIL